MLLIDYLKARGIEIPAKIGVPLSGWNKCHDAFASIYMPDDVNKPIHSCKCIAEGVRTVRKIDEYLCQCPSCGGIIVRNKPVLSVYNIEQILSSAAEEAMDSTSVYKKQAQAIHSLLTAVV